MDAEAGVGTDASSTLPILNPPCEVPHRDAGIFVNDGGGLTDDIFHVAFLGGK